MVQLSRALVLRQPNHTPGSSKSSVGQREGLAVGPPTPPSSSRPPKHTAVALPKHVPRRGGPGPRPGHWTCRSRWADQRDATLSFGPVRERMLDAAAGRPGRRRARAGRSAACAVASQTCWSSDRVTCTHSPGGRRCAGVRWTRGADPRRRARLEPARRGPGQLCPLEARGAAQGRLSSRRPAASYARAGWSATWCSRACA